MKMIHRLRHSRWACGAQVLLLPALICGISALHAAQRTSQAESTPASSQDYAWVNVESIEGHLARNSSPDAAFSPDSSNLALVNGDRIVIEKLAGADITIQKVLHPKIKGLRDMSIESANFLNADTLILFGTGVVKPKKGPAHQTALLGFLWNIQQDALQGDLAVFGRGGGYGRPRYFPGIKYLGMYKDSAFVLWSPITRKGVELKVPELTREPHLYTFSPHGHWLLLAQIAGGGSSNPIVVNVKAQKFVNALSGYTSTVMSMGFSHDGKKLVTASANGKIRIWSVPKWDLLETMTGHEGPARWAEFSPDGQWVVSGGEDQTVRIWSAGNGKLIQTLSESHAPIDTVCFSPNGNYVAASTDKSVLIWRKTPTGP